ncbi:MAG: hypothetical protein ACTS73_06085 [Arsenophonus sp. NEOnobi-MAG3]
MMSIHSLKQVIPLLSCPYCHSEDVISWRYSRGLQRDIVTKSSIARKHLTILLEVLWRNYITRINGLVILNVC